MTVALHRTLTWLDQARCADTPDWTNTPEGQRGAQAIRDRIDLCRRCPVIDACAAHAIAVEQTHVVQAGVKLPPTPGLAGRVLRAGIDRRARARQAEQEQHAEAARDAAQAAPRRPRSRLTGAQKVEIQRLRYAEGWSVARIADRFGMARTTVYKVAPELQEAE